jgi:ABC-2 type transport system permease protein
MSTLALAGVSLRRLVRDRIALFFMLVLPVVVIIVIGATVGGFGQFHVGVVDNDHSALARALVSQLEQAKGLEVAHYADEKAMRVALRRSEVAAAVVIPAGFDAKLRAGARVQVPVFAEQANQLAQGAQTSVSALIANHAGAVQAAHFTATQTGAAFDVGLRRAHALEQSTGQVTVRARTVDSKSNILPNGFSYSAPTMLVLFVFINSVAFGATAIETRRLGVYERALAAPVHARAIVMGEVTVALGLAVLQSALIVGIGALAFGVSWGNPLAAAALVVTWAFVGAGAGMLSGTLFRTPQQASSIGPAVGIALGMLGGCMWPLQIVGSFMRTVGHFTPHAWAVDAWTKVLSRAGTISDILGPLAVLAAFATALLTIAVVRMRRVLIP